MNSHKNARLTPKGRAHLIEQIALLGLPEAAQRAGIQRTPGAYCKVGRPCNAPRFVGLVG